MLDPCAGMSPEDLQEAMRSSRRWLQFMWHCARCEQDEQHCRFGHRCTVGHELWAHMLECRAAQCAHPRCIPTKRLLQHHIRCKVRLPG